MQNEHHFQSSGDAEGKLARQRSKEEKWAAFAHDLERLGHQLSELSSHAAVFGDHIIQRLDAQYQTVRNRADVWKQTTDQQINELRKLACHQGRDAQGAFSDIEHGRKPPPLQCGTFRSLASGCAGCRRGPGPRLG